MDGKLENAVWVTWERQTRNASMASVLALPLIELESTKPRLRRYLQLSLATISLIRKHKIRYLFVQNPSIVLSSLAVAMRRLFGYIVVVDAHNAGIDPFEGRSVVANAVTRYIIRRADLVIVTNTVLAKVVQSRGGVPFIMPDPIPDFPEPKSTFRDPYLLLICSWSDDEPYGAIIKSMASRPGVKLLITGNYKKKLSESDITELPDNVILLGHISESDYIECLARAQVAIDLTTREDCLVCGAYEAASLATPCLITNSIVNREVFFQGFVYTDTDVDSIYTAIGYALEHVETLRADIAKFAFEHREETLGRASRLLQQVRELNG